MTPVTAGPDRIQDPEFVEAMLRRTGGTEIDVMGVQTWGHERSTRGGEAVPQGFEARPGGAERIVVVSRGILPGEVRVGTALDVDGEPVQVLDHQLVEDGKLLAMQVGAWKHEVRVYERQRSGTETRGHQEGTPEKLGQTVCDIEARDGEVSRGEAADYAESRWQGWFPPSVDFVRTGAILVVVDGRIPTRHLEVTFVGDLTDRWRMPFRAREAEESIELSEFTDEFTDEFA